MNQLFKSSFRLAVVAGLVFAAINLPFLIHRIPESTSQPPCIVGITGWLWVMRGRHGPTIQRVDLIRLLGEICFAGLVAWILLKALRRFGTHDTKSTVP